MAPDRWTARCKGASFCNAKCVRARLANQRRATPGHESFLLSNAAFSPDGILITVFTTMRGVAGTPSHLKFIGQLLKAETLSTGETVLKLRYWVHMVLAYSLGASSAQLRILIVTGR